MNSQWFYVFARALIVSVFIGLGLERLLGAAGILDTGGAVTTAAMLFSAFELLAGLLILFGWQVRWLSLLMAAFLIVDMFIAHPFWRFSGAEQHAQLLHFLKNCSSIGGLLLLAWAEGRRRHSRF